MLEQYRFVQKLKLRAILSNKIGRRAIACHIICALATLLPYKPLLIKGLSDR